MWSKRLIVLILCLTLLGGPAVLGAGSPPEEGEEGSAPRPVLTLQTGGEDHTPYFGATGTGPSGPMPI